MKPTLSSPSETKFCPYCGKENLSFAKYCSGCGTEIPESNFESQNNLIKDQSDKELNHVNKLNTPKSKVINWKRYRGLIILIVLATIFIITNPNEKKHLDFVKEKVLEKLDRDEYFEPEIAQLIESEIDDQQSDSRLLKDYVKRKNYIFLSLSEVKTEDEYKVVSIGVLGNFIDLERVDNNIKKLTSEYILLIIFGVITLVGLISLIIIVRSRKIKGSTKIAWVLVAVILVSIFGYVATGPFITFSSIKTGIVEKDSEKLSENIDFPALRQNIKEQFNASMIKNASEELEGNFLSIIAVGLASKFVDEVVDLLLTPSGLTTFMEGKKSGKGDDKSITPTFKKDELFKNVRYSYDSLSKFSIWVTNEMEEEIRFVLKREGFSWKLVNIVIPINEQL